MKKLLGLVLSGGGARGAYQVGVLKAIAELNSKYGKRIPFSVLTGVSAGSINSTALAGYADDFAEGVSKLENLWGNLTPNQVFKTDVFAMGKISMQWIRELSLGPLQTGTRSRALLNTEPLRELLANNIPFDRLRDNIANKVFRSVSLSATDYGSALGVTFIETNDKIELWKRNRRLSEFSVLTTDHVMASSAIPMFFPPIKVGSKYFGDGCLRNTAPLSPAVHLGSENMIIVGVRKERKPDDPVPHAFDRPSLARVMSVILNAVLMDGIDVDIERLSRISNTVNVVPEALRAKMGLRPVDFLLIHPSEDIGAIAGTMYNRLPKIIRYMLSGLGSPQEASEIVSYLLFDSEFTRILIDLGYRDTMRARLSVEQYLAVAENNQV